jgi:hypothetical protein
MKYKLIMILSITLFLLAAFSGNFVWAKKAAAPVINMEAKYGGRHTLASQLTWNDLYRFGGAAADISYSHFKTVTVKLFTVKEEDILKNRFLVSARDNLNDSDSLYSQGYPITWRGNVFMFNDYFGFFVRESDKGNETLVSLLPLKIKGGARAFIDTTINKLFRERAKQAVYAGSRENINGEDFYVIFCGGWPMTLEFFPADIKNHIVDGTEDELTPAYVALLDEEVDGKLQWIHKSDIGTINGKHYYFDFDSRVVREGYASSSM